MKEQKEEKGYDEENNEELNNKKVAKVLTVLVIIAILFILILRGCSVVKKTEKEGTMGVASVEGQKPTEENNGMSIHVVNNQDTSKIDGFNQGDATVVEVKDESETETSRGSEEVANTESFVEVEEDLEETERKPIVEKHNKEVSNGLSLTPVGDVNIVEKYNTDALVSSKNMYLLDDYIYVYSLKLIMSINGEYRVVDYLCSVSSWNAVDVNESIAVEYGVDEGGKIIVLSLSKKE